METPNTSIALLIDADNSPASKIDFIVAELASYGRVNIRRAYGNWKKRGLIGWEKILNEYAITAVQHFDLVKGKNATDMGLTIDAMDILYTRDVDVFCLVSSDSDFTPLILRLREEGKQVLGFGASKTPIPFVNACTKFLMLDEDEQAKAERKKRGKSTANLKGDSKLISTLRSAIEASQGEDGWASLGPVGSNISNQASFDPRNYGFTKLSDLLESIDLFELKKEPNSGSGSGKTISVREKR